MGKAAKILILCLGATALAACQQQTRNRDANQEMSMDSNLPEGQLPANAEIETLPPDESSGTSSTELNAGEDNPDVNELSSSH